MGWDDLTVIGAQALQSHDGCALRSPVVKDRSNRVFVVANPDDDNPICRTDDAATSEQNFASGVWLAVPPLAAVRGSMVLLVGKSTASFLAIAGAQPESLTLMAGTYFRYLPRIEAISILSSTGLALIAWAERLLEAARADNNRPPVDNIQRVLRHARYFVQGNSQQQRKILLLLGAFYERTGHADRLRALASQVPVEIPGWSASEFLSSVASGSVKPRPIIFGSSAINQSRQPAARLVPA